MPDLGGVPITYNEDTSSPKQSETSVVSFGIESLSKRPVRIANCSGFFGDRLSAAAELVQGGPIDVLTGDWLAELTMLILARQRLKQGPGSGYAKTFLLQMKQVLGACLNRDIRVVSNAGGLDPAGCAAALRELADEAGIDGLRIAYVTGDDLTERFTELTQTGESFTNLDTGEDWAQTGWQPLTANAYIGARGITEALFAGAHVVITGRVTDAALTIGPAAWWHNWSYDKALAGDELSLDRLAGALVAGHVIECGTQATGGNYSFFTEIENLENVGFPIAEVSANGDSTITKHIGTGGEVSVGTVTAQLLYEIGGPEYLNPDVTALFDTIRLDQEGVDRVRISGVEGALPPERLKVAVNTLGGFRNTTTLVLTGSDIDAKADLALQTTVGVTLADVEELRRDPSALAQRSRLDVAQLDVQVLSSHPVDPSTAFDAQSFVRITVKDSDPKKVGRAFTGPIIESALASYPGMFATTPPTDGAPYGVYWPTTVDPSVVPVTVQVEGRPAQQVSPGGSVGAEPTITGSDTDAGNAAEPEHEHEDEEEPITPITVDDSDRVVIELGQLVGARSGDKGGSANVGFWIPLIGDGREDARYEWFVEWLTEQRIRELLPEADELPIAVHPLPNLLAVNVVIGGILGRGVAESTRLDPQAKGLGEQFRARVVSVPAAIVPDHVSPL